MVILAFCALFFCFVLTNAEIFTYMSAKTKQGFWDNGHLPLMQ